MNWCFQVLSEENLQKVCLWCKERDIVLMADEVYQENIWKDGAEFVSCRKVAYDLDLCKSLCRSG